MRPCRIIVMAVPGQAREWAFHSNPRTPQTEAINAAFALVPRIAAAYRNGGKDIPPMPALARAISNPTLTVKRIYTKECENSRHEW